MAAAQDALVPPAVRALDEIQAAAIEGRCSDIHFEPFGGGGRVRLRCDGVLRESRTVPAPLFAQISSRVKILSGMDIAERRQPQDGRYAIRFAGRTVEARTSAMPTIEGEKIVLRLLDYDASVPALGDLGMPAPMLERFSASVRAPHGFVVVAGPTGSGKTTTLYASVATRDLRADNICSVEDPVELRLPGLAQVQVNIRAGVTFASALRGFLRQDPDVVMVGELRDAETAAVASAASLSGILVMTTLHANDAFAAIERLVEFGVKRHTIAAGLSAVISQRLLRRNCVACRGSGCERCDGSGFSGRLAIFEAVFLDAHLRSLIACGAASSSLRTYAQTRGYVPMTVHGKERIERGETTADELRRAAAWES